MKKKFVLDSNNLSELIEVYNDMDFDEDNE